MNTHLSIENMHMANKQMLNFYQENSTQNMMSVMTIEIFSINKQVCDWKNLWKKNMKNKHHGIDSLMNDDLVNSYQKTVWRFLKYLIVASYLKIVLLRTYIKIVKILICSDIGNPLF